MSEKLKQKFCGDAGVFYEGLAVTEVDGKWFHILEDGRPAYPERYDMVEYFQNGLAWAKKGETWIKINKKGKKAQTENTSSAN